MALEWERVERQAASGAVTTIQLRKVLNDMSERIIGDTLVVPSVEDYLNDWLKGIVARNRAATIERYRKTTRLFLESLNGKARQPVTAVTPKDVETFLNERLATGVAPQTAIIDLKTMNTAFRRAEAYGIIHKNPVAAVRPPKENRSEREIFTHEEVQKILNAVPSLDWQTLIILGYFIGARLSDCVNIRWENIHADEGVIIYQQRNIVVLSQ
jgi:site-specific recombinase XerD